MQVLAASCEPVFAMTEKEIIILGPSLLVVLNILAGTLPVDDIPYRGVPVGDTCFVLFTK